MNFFTVIRFITKNWGLISELILFGVSAVTAQSQRKVSNSTKRKDAFTAMREALPSSIGDSWINLGIELSLAMLRWRNVL
jgi:hypothetical protein